MEGGRVNHSWCMGVVSHRYGGLGGGRMVVVGVMSAGQSHEELVAYREMS